MAVPDHVSPVAPRNHSLARTTVVSSSQTRTRATMLALTSHYSATNTKHPRHAPWSRGSRGLLELAGLPRGYERGARCRVLLVGHPPSDLRLSVVSSGLRVRTRSRRRRGPAQALRLRWSIVVARTATMFHRCGCRRGWGAESGCGAGAGGSWGTGEVLADGPGARARFGWKRGLGWGGGPGGGRRTRRREADPEAGGGPGGEGWGGEADPGRGMIAEAANIHSCSDIRARNRTRFANVSLGTDDATRGRPPVPGAVRYEWRGSTQCLPDTASRSSCRPSGATGAPASAISPSDSAFRI